MSLGPLKKFADGFAVRGVHLRKPHRTPDLLLFGKKGELSIRGGYSLVYDHFGVGTANTFDSAGSFGLTSQVSNPPGTVTVGSAPRC